MRLNICFCVILSILMVNISTADSKLYENRNYRFKLEYPADWKIVNYPVSGDSFGIEFRSTNYASFKLGIYPSDQPTLDQFLAERDYSNLTAYEGYPSTRVHRQWRNTISGFDAVERIEVWCAAGITTRVTFIQVNSLIYSFQLIPAGGEYTPDEEKEYEMILKSFDIDPEVPCDL